jgi:NADP-dependent 3-hydroxy acid dehydrogenase YdfG
MAVTLVTGASSGIGRSLARRIAAHGDPVAVLARRRELLDELVDEIERAGGRALALACDVTDCAAVAAAVREVERRLGPVECLVANAGGGEPTFVDRFRAAEIEATLRLNVVGVANCVEAVLPGMLARGAGQLVATGSLAGEHGLPTGAAYSAAKAALRNLMESLRIDLRGRGIAVTLIAPGPVRLKRKSKKGRLLSVDLEAATARMHRAILRRAPYLAFPRVPALGIALVRALPIGIADRLLAGRGRRPGPESNRNEARRNPAHPAREEPPCRQSELDSSSLRPCCASRPSPRRTRPALLGLRTSRAQPATRVRRAKRRRARAARAATPRAGASASRCSR